MLFSFDLLQNIRYSSLIFSYSKAEYWSRICCRSTWFIYTSMVLNDALRVVTDASISLKRTIYDLFQTSSHQTFDNYVHVVTTIVLPKSGTSELSSATFSILRYTLKSSKNQQNIWTR